MLRASEFSFLSHTATISSLPCVRVPTCSGSRYYVKRCWLASNDSIMFISSATSFGPGAEFRHHRVPSKLRGSIIFAVVLCFCGCRSSIGLLAEAPGFPPPPDGFAEEGKSSRNGVDDGLSVIHERAFLGDDHQGAHMRFSVLPGEWMDGEMGRCHPASRIYTRGKGGLVTPSIVSKMRKLAHIHRLYDCAPLCTTARRQQYGRCTHRLRLCTGERTSSLRCI